MLLWVNIIGSQLHRSGTEQARINVDAAFLAVGWPGNADAVDATRIGNDADREWAKVDAGLRSSMPHMFVAG